MNLILVREMEPLDERQMIFKKTVFFSLLSILVLGLGCAGGGTAGTGGIEVSGALKTTDGDPVVNATVTIAETGDSVVTDSSGNFRFDEVEEISAATFVVTVDETALEAESADLPKDAVKVEVELELNAPANRVEVKSITAKSSGSSTALTTTTSTTTTTLRRSGGIIPPPVADDTPGAEPDTVAAPPDSVEDGGGNDVNS